MDRLFNTFSRWSFQTSLKILGSKYTPYGPVFLPYKEPHRWRMNALNRCKWATAKKFSAPVPASLVVRPYYVHWVGSTRREAKGYHPCTQRPTIRQTHTFMWNCVVNQRYFRCKSCSNNNNNRLISLEPGTWRSLLRRWTRSSATSVQFI
jgi:hypothetical protein